MDGHLGLRAALQVGDRLGQVGGFGQPLPLVGGQVGRLQIDADRGGLWLAQETLERLQEGPLRGAVGVDDVGILADGQHWHDGLGLAQLDDDGRRVEGEERIAQAQAGRGVGRQGFGRQAKGGQVDGQVAGGLGGHWAGLAGRGQQAAQQENIDASALRAGDVAQGVGAAVVFAQPDDKASHPPQRFGHALGRPLGQQGVVGQEVRQVGQTIAEQGRLRRARGPARRGGQHLNRGQNARQGHGVG